MLGLLTTWMLWSAGTEDSVDQNAYLALDNGLQLVVDSRPGSKLIHAVFAIGLGSRDEKEGENGLVHLLEHVMLLGGTKTISAPEFAFRLRSNGVYFNAHTDHDLMTLEFTFTPGHLEDVLKLAREKLFFVDFSQETLDREKKAIIEEINQINDDPMKRGRQMIMSSLFGDHAYARPVYGDVNVVEAAVPETLVDVYRRHFVPGNMSLAITGGVDLKRAQELVRLYYSEFEKGEELLRDSVPPLEFRKNEEMALTMDIEGHHLLIGFPAPAMNDPSRLAFDMVVQIFGRGYNPLLRQALRSSGRSLVETVNPAFLTMERAGLYLIHIRCEEDKITRIKRDALQFFVRAARMPFTLSDVPPNQRQGAIDHIENALTHLKMSFYSFQENGMALASAYARSLLLQKENHDDDYLTRLSRLKSRELNKVIDRYLVGRRFSVLVIKPMEKR